MPVLIPELPEHLVEIPPAASSPDDPTGDEKRAAWYAWRQEIARLRLETAFACEHSPEIQEIERELCRRNPVYFLTMWGWLYEPRAEEPGDDEIPFIPFARQAELIYEFEATLQSKGAEADLIVSKSRDMGASWAMCGYALWGWLFKRPWQVRLMSRKGDLVDARSPDSLFWKIDWIRDRLPGWMLPPQFSEKEDRGKMKLINSENSNQIGGESTTTEGLRAGRATWTGFDELAFADGNEESWDSTANSTYHRIGVSSESNKKGPGWQNIKKGINRPKPPRVFVMNWWDHPDHTHEWFVDMRERMDAESFAQEVLRDPTAGGSSLVYPAAQQKLVQPRSYQAGLPTYVGIDPGFSDETVIGWFQDNPITGEFVVLDGYFNKRMIADYYGTILNGRQEQGPWQYDERALELIQWVNGCQMHPQYFGDTYGDQVNGATMDSFYDRLRKRGIHVNVDRLPSGQISAYQDQARTHAGRRAALRELIPRMVFANTPGAQMMLRALQENQFKDDDRPVMFEAKVPLHDWTSHWVTCMEFVAVNLAMRRGLQGRDMKRPTRPPQRPPMPKRTVRYAQRQAPRWERP